MTAKIIDGEAIAAEVRNEVKVGVDKLKASGITPCLAAVLVGDVPASQVYVRTKRMLLGMTRKMREKGHNHLEILVNIQSVMAELMECPNEDMDGLLSQLERDWLTKEDAA